MEVALDLAMEVGKAAMVEVGVAVVCMKMAVVLVKLAIVDRSNHCK